MMSFFEKACITFEGTDEYQPIEWCKIRTSQTPEQLNGIQIKRQFPPTQDFKSFTLKLSLDLE